MKTADVQLLQDVAQALDATEMPRVVSETTGVAELATGKAVSATLRIVGSLILVAASVAFLVQRWGAMSDTLRYLSFLGFTATLAGAGFLCGIRLKEDKGARTFLAVAALMVTVNFAQLGALLYSTVAHISRAAVPALLLWTAPSLGAAVTTMIGASALLAIITLIAMRALARGVDRLLGISYLALNALLLIPTRDSHLVELLFAAGILGATEVDRRFIASNVTKTTESTIARVLLFLPPLVLVGRSFVIYAPTESMCGLTLLTIAYVLVAHIPNLLSDAEARASEVLGYIAGGLGWACVAHSFVRSFDISTGLYLPIFALPLAAVFALLSLRARDSGTLERSIALWVIIGSGVLEISHFDTLLSSLYCIAIGIGATADGYAGRRKATFLSGMVCLGCGLLHQIQYAIELYSMSPWVTLAIIGILVVIASSYLERNYSTVARVMRAFALRLKAS